MRENYTTDRLDAILFDFDGTLVNTTPLILRSYQATWQHNFGYTWPDEVYIRTFGTHLISSIDDLIGLGVTEGRIDPPADRQQLIGEVVTTYRRFNLGWHDEMIEPFPGIHEMLGDLKQRGLPLGIVSSKLRSGVERGLRLFDLEHFFNSIVSAEDTERHKPDPEPILHGLAAIGSSPVATLYLGDSTHDIRAGRAAGTLTAAAAWGPFPRPDLEAVSPDFIIDSPTEFATGIGEVLPAISTP